MKVARHSVTQQVETKSLCKSEKLSMLGSVCHGKARTGIDRKKEQETGLEPATATLATWSSTS